MSLSLCVCVCVCVCTYVCVCSKKRARSELELPSGSSPSSPLVSLLPKFVEAHVLKHLDSASRCSFGLADKKRVQDLRLHERDTPIANLRVECLLEGAESGILLTAELPWVGTYLTLTAEEQTPANLLLHLASLGFDMFGDTKSPARNAAWVPMPHLPASASDNDDNDTNTYVRVSPLLNIMQHQRLNKPYQPYTHTDLRRGIRTTSTGKDVLCIKVAGPIPEKMVVPIHLMEVQLQQTRGTFSEMQTRLVAHGITEPEDVESFHHDYIDMAIISHNAYCGMNMVRGVASRWAQEFTGKDNKFRDFDVITIDE